MSKINTKDLKINARLVYAAIIAIVQANTRSHAAERASSQYVTQAKNEQSGIWNAH
jgi:hypothetical protein